MRQRISDFDQFQESLRHYLLYLYPNSEDLGEDLAYYSNVTEFNDFEKAALYMLWSAITRKYYWIYARIREKYGEMNDCCILEHMRRAVYANYGGNIIEILDDYIHRMTRA